MITLTPYDEHMRFADATIIQLVSLHPTRNDGPTMDRVLDAMKRRYLTPDELPETRGEELAAWLEQHPGYRAWEAEQVAHAVPLRCPEWCREGRHHPLERLQPVEYYVDHATTVLHDESADDPTLHVEALVCQDHPEIARGAELTSEVYLAIGDDDCTRLTPERARLLGQALLEAADKAEGGAR